MATPPDTFENYLLQLINASRAEVGAARYATFREVLAVVAGVSPPPSAGG